MKTGRILATVYFMLSIVTTSAYAAVDVSISQLSRYFGYEVAITANVPTTTDEFSVLQLQISAPSDIRSPGTARFVLTNSSGSKQFTQYHYGGYANGTHQYLVSVPKTFSGNVPIDVYLDMRTPVTNTYSSNRDDLIKNTVVLGANDIVLVVDTSGSMGSRVGSGTRMTLAQQVVNSIGPQLELEGNNVAVIDYDGSNRVTLDLDEPFRPQSFNAGGGTGTSNAIQTARKILDGRPSPGKIILVITDGAPNSRSATDAQINAVAAMKDQGWAIAGLGMGINLSGPYPIKQNVSDSNATNVLQGTLLSMVQTAQEQVRDVNSVCSGDKCKALSNDITPPTVTIESKLSCIAPKDAGDILINVTDNFAGIDRKNTFVQVQFSDGQLFDLPTTIVNHGEVATQESTGLGSLKVTYQSDLNAINQNAALKAQFEKAYMDSIANGGQKPYMIKVSVKDIDGNNRDQNLSVNPRVADSIAPSITLETGQRNGILLNSQDLYLSVSDDLSGIDSSDISLRFSYGNDNVELLLSEFDNSGSSSDACFARKPLSVTVNLEKTSLKNNDLMNIFSAAFTDDEPITVESTAIDWSGNKSSKKISVKFSPETHTTNIMVAPGVTHQFHHENGVGALVISPDIVVQDSEIKNVRYFARLSSLQDTPVVLNGKTIRGGETVDMGDFSLDDNLEFDLSGASELVKGEAKIRLIPNMPGVRILEIPTRLWLPEAEQIVANENPIQLFNRISVKLSNKEASGCIFTGLENTAANSDPISGARCYVKWTKYPEETYPLEQNIPELSGFTPSVGEQKFSYEISIFDTDGTEVKLGEGNGVINVVPAKDVMSFGFGRLLDNSYRIVSNVTGNLVQENGPACSTLTLDHDIALDMSAKNRPACLITWESLPEGIDKVSWTDMPTVRGFFNQKYNDAFFKWRVSSYSTSGRLIELFKESQVIPLLDPPAPTVTFGQNNEISEGLFDVNMAGGYVTDFRVNSINAEIIIEAYENGALIFEDMLFPGYGDTSTYYSSVSIDAKPLWTKTNYTVKARYNLLQNIGGSGSIDIISSPSSSVSPETSVEKDVVLNTEDFEAIVSIKDPYEDSGTYDARTMGEWDVRLIDAVSYMKEVPLSEFKEVDSAGQQTFDLKLKDLNSGFMRLSAEANLKSPYPEYSRTVKGRRPIFVTVLRGEAIDSKIEARRLMGEAPLLALTKIVVKDQLDNQAVGEIKWQTRKKGEETWVEIESDPRMPDRLLHLFETGQHEMRANVFNAYSGAMFTTETIEIYAYNIPELDLKAPTNAFIGSKTNLSITAGIRGEVVDPSNLVVQWSEDDGETWIDGDNTYSLTRNEESRVSIAVRARMADAPDDWDDAFAVEHLRLSYRPVREPRSGFYGARVIEEGREVVWQGMAATPYPNMDVTMKGRFILPDGSIVDEDKVAYTASKEDSLKERIEVSYEVWIEGFEDQGAISKNVRLINVWSYDWPEWKFYDRMSTIEAPSEVTLMIYNPAGNTRYIEGLKYEWIIPEEAEIIKDSFDGTRVVKFNQAGKYTIIAKISDERGHYTEMTKDILVESSDTWNIGMRMMPSNVNMNAPLELRIMPEIDGGHPRDRISGYRYLVDGEEVSEGKRFVTLLLQEDGQYDITLELTSNFGKVVSKTERIEVIKNIKPTCELGVSESSGRFRFRVDCQDLDGRVAEFEWMLNGEMLPVRGSRLSYTGREGDVFEIQVRGIDNGGKASDTITWTGGTPASSGIDTVTTVDSGATENSSANSSNGGSENTGNNGNSNSNSNSNKDKDKDKDKGKFQSNSSDKGNVNVNANVNLN